MPSDRKVRKFIRQWRKRYPYPVEWVDDRANKQCRRSEAKWLAQLDGAVTLRRREIVALIEWRFSHQANRREQALGGATGAAESGHAKRCIKKALATSNPVTALDCLLGERGGIPGWGPVMASVVLAACRPNTYAVADYRALRTLRALDLCSPCAEDEFVRADWQPYLRTCWKLASLCGLSLREVHQALWAAADEAPGMPKASKHPKAW